MRRLWLAITLILALLTVAVWTQLPHFLETIGRDSLLETGHWLNRRPLQAVVIGLIGSASAAAIAAVLLRSEADWPTRLLFVGALAIACEILIDTVSLHYVDAILAYRILSLFSVSAAIKVIGIVWIWSATAMASGELLGGRRNARPNPRRRS